MAQAYLVPEAESEEGEAVCSVGLDGCADSPVDAARLLPGRRWGSPRMEDDTFYFDYRSIGDDIMSFVAAGSSKGLKLGRSSARHRVASWLSNAVDELASLDDSEDEDDRVVGGRHAPESRVLGEVRADASCIFDAGSQFHAHGQDCPEEGMEEEFATAAEALDLPRWASATSCSAGGPGSGFTQAIIVLKKGRTFDELAAWLLRRAARARGDPSATHTSG